MENTEAMVPEKIEQSKMLTHIVEIRNSLFNVLESFIDVGNNVFENIPIDAPLKAAEEYVNEVEDRISAFLNDVENFKTNITAYKASSVTSLLYEFSQLVKDFDDSNITAFNSVSEQLAESYNVMHELANDNGLVLY